MGVLSCGGGARRNVRTNERLRLHTVVVERKESKEEKDAENRARNELNQRSPLPHSLSLSIDRPLLPRLPLSASLLRRRGANFAMILFAPSRDDDRPTARDMAHEGISRMTNAIRLHSTGRSKCSRSGLVERVPSLRLCPHLSVVSKRRVFLFPSALLSQWKCRSGQRGIHLPRSRNFWALKKKRKKQAAERGEGGGERQKEPSSLTHPHRIRRHQKQDLSL